MPMMMLRCRFENPAPSQEQLDAEFTRQLGPRGPAMLRDLERRDDNVIDLLSTDAVALVYGLRALVALGATSVDFRGNPREVEWPPWSDRPWTSYGMLQKVRISLSRFRL